MSAETAPGHVVQLLGRVPLFNGLPRSDLEQIAGVGVPRELRPGEFVFREGDPGDRLYLVAEGAVEILRERPLGDHERLSVKRGGESFGEAALLDDAPRRASVRAVEPSRLVTIGRADFAELLGGESLALRLLRSAARALRAHEGRSAARSEGNGDPFRDFGRLVLSVLAPVAMPRSDAYLIAGGTARAESTGGSSLGDAVVTDDGRILLALLDVKGGGLPPAYLIGVTRAVLHEVASSEPLDGLLRRLNAATVRNLFAGLDECVDAAVLQIHGDALSWSSAGEQPAVILRSDGEVDELAGHGPPLGILPRFEYGVSELDLAPGDTLLAFSEAPAGMVNGAVDLARGRLDTEPMELARLLEAAFSRVQARGAATDLSFFLVRKR
jgi:sigma-B regulation protein RsbU (phosphoserine phosphatase)